ncbi:MAG: peptidoglycan recognition family protein [Anaerolineae bacterium]
MFSSERERFFDGTGHTVRGAFLEFWERFGEEVLGLPITEAFEENGVTSQYFERVALESPALGEVRLKPLGQEVLRLREMVHRPRPMVVRPPIIDLVHDLPRHVERRYETRTLAQVQQIVIHHTATDPSVGIEAIATKHVDELGWPGIGYHFVIDAGGRIYQTNNLTTVSFHARQANPTTVGITFSGNFDEAMPTEAQLAGGGRLCAYLLRELSLPLENVRGHKDFVSTGCPGRNWVEGAFWRDALIAQIQNAKFFHDSH